jgi:hypothetical protein
MSGAHTRLSVECCAGSTRLAAGKARCGDVLRGHAQFLPIRESHRRLAGCRQVACHLANDRAADVTLEIMIRYASHSIPARKALTDASAVPTMDYWLAPSVSSSCADVLTIDLEDWPVAVLGPGHEVTDRVLDNTRRVLQILRWHGVSATFFVLTCVAERFPDLVREVPPPVTNRLTWTFTQAGNGDESGRISRGCSSQHRCPTQVVGERPIGYRLGQYCAIHAGRGDPFGAGFQIQFELSHFPSTLWLSDAPRRIHRWKECGLVEVHRRRRLAGRNWPVAAVGISD